MQVALRPRTPWEAMDLGTRLVQTAWRTVLRVYGPPALVIALLACATAWWNDWAPIVVIFMAKPWLDRALLLVYSRAVFGQPTAARDAWRSGVLLGWKPLLLSLTWRRLSPWRAVTQPVQQLEGLQGRAAAQRRRVLLTGRHWSAGVQQFLFANLEWLLTFAVMSLALFAVPGMRQPWLRLMGADDDIMDFAESLIYAVVALVLEAWFVAAGFATYLNRRVELEAWDVERALREAFDD